MKEQFSEHDPHRQAIHFVENLKNANLYTRKRKVTFWVGIVPLAIAALVVAGAFAYSFVLLPTGNDDTEGSTFLCPSVTWLDEAGRQLEQLTPATATYEVFSDVRCPEGVNPVADFKSDENLEQVQNDIISKALKSGWEVAEAPDCEGPTVTKDIDGIASYVTLTEYSGGEATSNEYSLEISSDPTFEKCLT